MIFDAFDAMSERAFLWWVVKVALGLAAFCAVVMLALWVWRKRRKARDARETEEFWRQKREEKERREKRRAELEGNAHLMGLLRHRAQMKCGAPIDAQYTMVGAGIRSLQVPTEPCEPIIPASAPKWDLLRPSAPFGAENIDLQAFPVGFKGKMRNLYVGYGSESKLVAWRLEA